MTAQTLRVVAVDLGATSGRVMVAEVSADVLELTQLHRFSNSAINDRGSLYWDVHHLHREVLAGLRLAAAAGPVHGIGIDSWAVDYGLLDERNGLLGNPYSYRDMRTDGIPTQVRNKIDARELYERTGIQQLPFNTIYQLVAAASTPPGLDQAATLLLLPDLLGHWLTGAIGAERTNASTTGLYDVRSRTWATDLAARVGVPAGILPPLRSAGERLGTLLPEVAASVGLQADVPVIAVGSHDTASAVVAVPSGDQPAAYISSGTWSLVGLELDQPVLTEEARLANFSNEAGVDATIRFLTNVMGLWVLSESLRVWNDDDPQDLPALLKRAAQAEPLRTVVDINDPILLPHGDMPARLATLAVVSGEPVPRTPVEVTRCILDSLAVAYRRHVRKAAALAGRDVAIVHVVGGGARNDLLCQLTADACELPVLAGPVEASALGNVLIQARALGVDLPDLGVMRALVRHTHDLRRFDPQPGHDWAAAEARATRPGTGCPT